MGGQGKFEIAVRRIRFGLGKQIIKRFPKLVRCKNDIAWHEGRSRYRRCMVRGSRLGFKKQRKRSGDYRK